MGNSMVKKQVRAEQDINFAAIYKQVVAELNQTELKYNPTAWSLPGSAKKVKIFTENISD